jgi:hypothetical protein
MWFSKFLYFPFGFLPPNLGLDFSIRSFKYLPFGPSLIAFVHTHPICSSTRATICLTSIKHLAHDMFNIATWHLLLLFCHYCLFLPSHGGSLRHKETKVCIRWFLSSDWVELQTKHLLWKWTTTLSSIIGMSTTLFNLNFTLKAPPCINWNEV